MTQIELIEDSIYNYPLVLLSIKDQSLIDIINNYLPYSIGIEIECNQAPTFDVNRFKNIPDIMEVNVDSAEQRYRIPNGLAGLICLYNICEELKINSELNPDSGHHYHVDMTNSFHLLSSEYIEQNEDWMLKELDTWKYTGRFNTRRIRFSTSHNWMRFQPDFKTAEIRIGNMTFDYNVIVSRLIHACTIIKRLVYPLLPNEQIRYAIPSSDLIKHRIKYSNTDNIRIKNLVSELSKLTQPTIQHHSITTNDTINQIVKRRIVKI